MKYQKFKNFPPKVMPTQHTFDINIYQLPSCVTTQYLAD